MSLVQRVTSIDGTDREPQPQLEGLFNGYGTPSYGTVTTPTYSLRRQPSHPHSLRHQRSLRHVISYDAIPKPEEPSQATNPSGGVTAYKVSNTRRIGVYSSTSYLILELMLTTSQPKCASPFLHVGSRRELSLVSQRSSPYSSMLVYIANFAVRRSWRRMLMCATNKSLGV